MNKNDTICDKVTSAVKILDRAVKTKELDIEKMGKVLHKIRLDAQKMEDGLKARKKDMIKAGIESQYQKGKGKDMLPPEKGGINKIKGMHLKTHGRIPFEVQIKKRGEIVYKEKAYAGLVSFVEQVKDIDDHGHIIGVTQKFKFGHPLTAWFAFDQFKQYLESDGLAISSFMRQVLIEGKFKNPEIKDKILGSLRYHNNRKYE